MKCLMRMCAEEEKGVVFYETVINIKWQKHTVIECVPLPWEEFEQVPAYFKVRDFLAFSYYLLLRSHLIFTYASKTTNRLANRYHPLFTNNPTTQQT